MRRLYGVLMVVACACLCTAATHADFRDEPRIDVFQGTERGTSVIVVTWPDGVVDKLKYKNRNVKDGNDSYIHWFDERYEAYEKRKK